MSRSGRDHEPSRYPRVRQFQRPRVWEPGRRATPFPTRTLMERRPFRQSDALQQKTGQHQRHWWYLSSLARLTASSTPTRRYPRRPSLLRQSWLNTPPLQSSRRLRPTLSPPPPMRPRLPPSPRYHRPVKHLRTTSHCLGVCLCVLADNTTARVGRRLVLIAGWEDRLIARRP